QQTSDPTTLSQRHCAPTRVPSSHSVVVLKACVHQPSAASLGNPTGKRWISMPLSVEQRNSGRAWKATIGCISGEKNESATWQWPSSSISADQQAETLEPVGG